MMLGNANISGSRGKSNGNKIDSTLVGRPLVPFFSADESVNAALATADGDHEDMDIDARIWNPDGYFEYPASKLDSPTKSNGKNSGQMILEMLRSGNSQEVSKVETSVQVLSVDGGANGKNKGKSSKGKSRSKSPGIEGKKRRDRTPGKKKKEEEKWAWSAFQNSPDPKSLPMPKLKNKNVQKNEKVHSSVLVKETSIRIDNEKDSASNVTIEQTMTEGLRKILNLG